MFCVTFSGTLVHKIQSLFFFQQQTTKGITESEIYQDYNTSILIITNYYTTTTTINTPPSHTLSYNQYI